MTWLKFILTKTVRTIDYEELDQGQGRLEIRRYHVVQDLKWLEGKEQWKGLGRLIKVHSTTEYLLNGRLSEDTRYYISSLSTTALELSDIVRAH